MRDKRTVEVFSAGCPTCDEAIAMVRELACGDCDISVLDMHEAGVAERARALGARSLPAVAIDGRLADCCAGRGPDRATLTAAGLGQQLAG